MNSILNYMAHFDKEKGIVLSESDKEALSQGMDSDNALADFIDKHEEQLATYHAENIDNSPNGDMAQEAFESWVQELDLEEAKDIIFGRKDNKKSDRDEYDNQVKFS